MTTLIILLPVLFLWLGLHWASGFCFGMLVSLVVVGRLALPGKETA